LFIQSKSLIFDRLSTIVKYCSDALTSLRFVDIRYDDFNLSDIDFSFATFANAVSNLRHFTFSTSDEMSGETIHRLLGLMPNLDSISFRDRSGDNSILQLFVALKNLRSGLTFWLRLGGHWLLKPVILKLDFLFPNIKITIFTWHSVEPERLVSFEWPLKIDIPYLRLCCLENWMW